MKKIATILILLLSIQSFSQVDQKAKTILDQVSAKTKSYSSISADFIFKMDNNKAKIHESNKGSLIIQGDKYFLSISGFEIISDAKTTWTYMKDAGEVNVSNANAEEDGTINPAKIFTIYNQGFKNTYLGEFTSNNKTIYKIELVPNETKEFNRVILEIDKSNYQIVGAVMFGTDDNQYSIIVQSMVTTKKFPDTTFVFNKSKYPGIEVIDMR